MLYTDPIGAPDPGLVPDEDVAMHRQLRRVFAAIALAVCLVMSLVGMAVAREVGDTTIPDNFGTHMACMGMGESGPHMPITGDGCWTP